MNGKIKNFIKRMLAGLVIGIGGIIPGVSGGILAVSMGLYKPMDTARIPPLTPGIIPPMPITSPASIRFMKFLILPFIIAPKKSNIKIIA